MSSCTSDELSGTRASCVAADDHYACEAFKNVDPDAGGGGVSSRLISGGS